MRSFSWALMGLAALSMVACTTERGRRDGGTGTGDGSIVGIDTGPAVFRCSPGVEACFGTTHYTCGADGVSRINEEVCAEQCSATLGCVTCVPGTRRCNGTVSEVCNAAASGYSYGRDCADWSASCGGDGFCADACADAERTNSNVGCEYWPVPLANNSELDPATFDFRVVIANPNDAPANIRVFKNGTSVWTGTVDAQGLRDVALPWIDGQSFATGTNDWDSLLVQGAYRLLSDVPVIVTQFNPFEYENGGTYSYTNDASLLLPVHTLTGNYVAASYLPLSRSFGSVALGSELVDPLSLPGYFTVVAVAPGTTRVSVLTSGAVAAGGGGRIAATRANETLTFDLSQGEVAHVMAAPPPTCNSSRPGYTPNRSGDCGSFFGCDVQDTCSEPSFDLTGSRITASQPVEVFGGHTCAYVPWTAQACDHLEEQMPPTETWGRDYVSAPMGDGSTTGTNVVRVVSAVDGTTVTVEPAQGGVSGGTLLAGQFLEFTATTPFHVTGSNAILVAQYLRGQFADTTEAERGDPSLTLLVPSEQYRSDYTFILPTSYNASTNGQNYLLVVRSPGQAITLDGAALTGTFQSVGAYEVGVVTLDGGSHHMASTTAFGIIAYGLGSYTSYATLAGLNLDPINILY